MTRIGEPISRKVEEITLSEHGPQPGLGWEISEDTLREIAEIEGNIRAANASARFVRFD